ncbi:MAG: hypothetical protein ACLSHW_04985 [Lachnospiraceae bacterium]
MSSAGRAVEDIMNQAVTRTDRFRAAVDSEEEMMDGAGSSGADSGNVSYKAADLLKTVKNLQKVSENTKRTAALDRRSYLSSSSGGIGVL